MDDITKIVGFDENGNRVGEDHPRAKLTDHEVDLIRELWETRKPGDGITARVLAEKFECSAGHICDIVNFNQRATYAVGWRRVAVTVNGAQQLGNMSILPRRPIAVRDADND